MLSNYINLLVNNMVNYKVRKSINKKAAEW